MLCVVLLFFVVAVQVENDKYTTLATAFMHSVSLHCEYFTSFCCLEQCYILVVLSDEL